MSKKVLIVVTSASEGTFGPTGTAKKESEKNLSNDPQELLRKLLCVER